MEELITFYAVLWLYEDIINDILGMRNHIILNSYDKPYRYSTTPKMLLKTLDCEGYRFIPYSDGKTQRELEKLRKKAVASQMRYD